MLGCCSWFRYVFSIFEQPVCIVDYAYVDFSFKIVPRLWMEMP